jgi:hypothetical protein
MKTTGGIMKPRTRPIPPDTRDAQRPLEEPDIDTSVDGHDVDKGVELPMTYTRPRPRHSPNHKV